MLVATLDSPLCPRPCRERRRGAGRALLCPGDRAAKSSGQGSSGTAASPQPPAPRCPSSAAVECSAVDISNGQLQLRPMNMCPSGTARLSSPQN